MSVAVGNKKFCSHIHQNFSDGTPHNLEPFREYSTIKSKIRGSGCILKILAILECTSWVIFYNPYILADAESSWCEFWKLSSLFFHR